MPKSLAQFEHRRTIIRIGRKSALKLTTCQFGIPAQVWREALGAHAERVFAPLRAAAPGALEELRYGHATTELRQAAAAHRAEVVVVARTGRSGLEADAWFGVAFTLAVRGPFATLVV